MKKMIALLVLAAFAAVPAYAMGRPMTQEEIQAREEKKKADIEASKDRKIANINAEQAEKKTEAWSDEMKAEAKAEYGN